MLSRDCFENCGTLSLSAGSSNDNGGNSPGAGRSKSGTCFSFSARLLWRRFGDHRLDARRGVPLQRFHVLIHDLAPFLLGTHADQPVNLRGAETI